VTQNLEYAKFFQTFSEKTALLAVKNISLFTK